MPQETQGVALMRSDNSLQLLTCTCSSWLKVSVFISCCPIFSFADLGQVCILASGFLADAHLSKRRPATSKGENCFSSFSFDPPPQISKFDLATLPPSSIFFKDNVKPSCATKRKIQYISRSNPDPQIFNLPQPDVPMLSFSGTGSFYKWNYNAKWTGPTRRETKSNPDPQISNLQILFLQSSKFKSATWCSNVLSRAVALVQNTNEITMQTEPVQLDERYDPIQIQIHFSSLLSQFPQTSSKISWQIFAVDKTHPTIPNVAGKRNPLSVSKTPKAAANKNKFASNCKMSRSFLAIFFPKTVKFCNSDWPFVVLWGWAGSPLRLSHGKERKARSLSLFYHVNMLREKTKHFSRCELQFHTEPHVSLRFANFVVWREFSKHILLNPLKCLPID